jgi:uncharacterized protein YndB with AHSA1/START domain
VTRAGFTVRAALLKMIIIRNAHGPASRAWPAPGGWMTPTSKGLQLQMTRFLEATPPTVWRALTEPAQLARWWGPAGFTCPSVELDVRVAGRYRIEMQPPQGAAFSLEGEFRDVTPPWRLAYTFRWEPPDPDDQETVATLSLTDLGGTTELMLDQRPFATRARLELHERGWSDSLARLAQHLLGSREA